MERKKIVAGNWKMNLNWVEAYDLVTAIKEQSKKISGVEKLIFPPFPYLQMLKVIVKDEPNFYVGAQNCSEHAKGAFTGEVSAAMIHSAGCSYILVGHSERRAYFSENNEQLLAKIKQALENNLKVIFCFGELLAERKNGKHFDTVQDQLTQVLSHFPKDKIHSLVLAYEPVWAIGTGETASPQQAQEMHAFVRKTVSGIFSPEIANTVSILYGGSCNAQNAKELFAGEDVDGGLIGGASLKAEDFCTIMASF
ncbi:MAG: triose-phosphate isomerase [bacterium]|nr:triose-phosphate isomerase [bacterium]